MSSLLRSVVLAWVLAVSGCTYASTRAIAPLEVRTAEAPFAMGEWCELVRKPEGSANGWIVQSSSSCGRLEWVAETRKVRASGPEDDRDLPAEFAVRPLGDGLMLVEFAGDSGEAAWMSTVVLVVDDAILAVRTLPSGDVWRLGPLHPDVILQQPEGEGSMPLLSGASSDILAALVRDAALVSLRQSIGRGAGVAEDADLDISVRDTLGAPDHPASPAQVDAVRRLLARAQSLAALAPVLGPPMIDDANPDDAPVARGVQPAPGRAL